MHRSGRNRLTRAVLERQRAYCELIISWSRAKIWWTYRRGEIEPPRDVGALNYSFEDNRAPQSSLSWDLTIDDRFSLTERFAPCSDVKIKKRKPIKKAARAKNSGISMATLRLFTRALLNEREWNVCARPACRSSRRSSRWLMRSNARTESNSA